MDFQKSTGQMGGCWVAKRLKAKGKWGKSRKWKVERTKCWLLTADGWPLHSPLQPIL